MSKQSNRGCASRTFEGIGVVTGGIIGACVGYFSDPADPIMNSVWGFLIGGVIGGVIGAFVPLLIIVGVIALIIWVVNHAKKPKSSDNPGISLQKRKTQETVDDNSGGIRPLKKWRQQKEASDKLEADSTSTPSDGIDLSRPRPTPL